MLRKHHVTPLIRENVRDWGPGEGLTEKTAPQVGPGVRHEQVEQKSRCEGTGWHPSWAKRERKS